MARSKHTKFGPRTPTWIWLGAATFVAWSQLLFIVPAFSQTSTATDSSTSAPIDTTSPSQSTTQQTQTKAATLSAPADSSVGSIGGVNTPEGTKVSSGGEATQTIPIIVPPGTAGIEPRLSFNYKSHGENSLLGVGWSISGLPAISRCPRTVVQDGVRSGVNYDTNDRFCLDGARLMVINGMAYGASGAEYRTEVDSFLKIVSYGSAGTGPAYFTVQTKGGETMEFGHSSDSLIEAVGRTEARVWALSKIQDIEGNYLTVSYSENPTNGEYAPSRIDYTSNTSGGLAGNRSVVFEYNAPYNPRSDQYPVYVGGSQVLTTQLLTNVKTYAPPADQPSNPVLVRDYRLDYETSPTTKRSRLIKITECAGDGTCLQPYQSAWDATVSTVISENWQVVNHWATGWTWVGDFNGDGKTDIASAVGGNVYMKLSNVTGPDSTAPRGP